DTAAEGEPEEIDLLEAERADEGDGVSRHLLDRVRDRSARRADPAVVEGDHPTLRGDAVDDSRVPVVEDRGQVVQEDEWDAAVWTELPVGEPHAAGVDGVRRRVLPRRVLSRTRGRVDSRHRFLSLYVLGCEVLPTGARSARPPGSARRSAGRTAAGRPSRPSAPYRRASPLARPGWRASRGTRRFRRGALPPVPASRRCRRRA